MKVEVAVGRLSEEIQRLIMFATSSCLKSVVVKRLRAPNSNSIISDQQSVGSNPQL